jgi:predicted nucleotidyltransferase
LVAAAEFGSGANGLAGPVSDVDVVFVYIRDLSCYFSIDPSNATDKNELIRLENLTLTSPLDPSRSISLDAQGFDARAAIKMIREGNLMLMDLLAATPPLYGTPQDQRDVPWVGLFFQQSHWLLQANPRLANKHLAWQLWGKATRHDKQFFKGRWTQKTLITEPLPCLHKKYFYVIVPLLRLFWLVQHTPDPSTTFHFPPLAYDALIEVAARQGLAPPPALADLITRKRTLGIDDSLHDTIPELDPWLFTLFSQLSAILTAKFTGAADPIAPWDRFWYELAMGAAALPIPSPALTDDHQSSINNQERRER